MWQAGLVALVFLFLSGSQSITSDYPWAWETINVVGKIGLGLISLYYGGRLIVHTRTHNLDSISRANRENHLIIAIALVVGCAIIG